MSDLNVYKFVQIGSAALILVMIVLARIGTYSEGLFIFYGLMIVAGAGVFYGARKLDEAERDRRLDEELRDKPRDE